MENMIGNRVQIFNYEVVDVEPIENIDEYKNHRRLRVFYNKGFKCVNYDKCGKEGEILVHGIDRLGNLHIDLCTKDLYPMTIDHIKPKSMGGKNNLGNLNPMCHGCNAEKGDRYKGKGQEWKGHQQGKIKSRRSYDIKIGDIVYRDGRRRTELMGKVVDIRPNLHHPRKVLSAQIEGRDEDSLYNIEQLYRLEPR